jgi:hypothetical protein
VIEPRDSDELLGETTTLPAVSGPATGWLSRHIGVQRTDEKTAKYWLIGIQSKCRDKRNISASPLVYWRNILSQLIDELIGELEASH